MDSRTPVRTCPTTPGKITLRNLRRATRSELESMKKESELSEDELQTTARTAATTALAVDALAPGLDLAPLGELLADPAVMKVFHAARQDIEIIFNLTGKTPVPLFDTQVAAMALGNHQFGVIKNLGRTRPV